MNTISTFQVGRTLFKWRKAIAAAVIVEAVLSHKMKQKGKRKSKSNPDIMVSASSMLTDMKTKAEEFITQTRKNIKK